ncbi:MAG: hypothetical protein ACK4UJ_09605 [Leptonema sp. (in: bacteria)]
MLWYLKILSILSILPILFGCIFISPKKPIYQWGAVEIYEHIPERCKHTKGLKQKKVILAKTEKELIEHYGITFLIYFNDGVSPILYGTLYHFDPENNLYCLALPNGKIALFRDKQIDFYRNNIIQEICYPIKPCEIYDEKNFILNRIR